MRVHARYAVLTALLLTSVAGAQSASSPRRSGTFADSGLYVCGRAAGGQLCHRRVGLGEALGDEFAAVRRAGGLSVVQLEGDWRGGDPEATRRRLRDWLVANDLSGVDVLTG